MRAEPTQALVLRAVDFGESDRVLHLLVPDTGRLAAIAKGARRSVRRFGGTLDLFNQLRVLVVRRRTPGLARLDGATLIRTYPALRADPRRFALGCYLLELLDRLAPEGCAPPDARRLFRFAIDALDAVESHPPDTRMRVLLELRALEALGLRPELRRCVRCQNEVHQARVGFLVADGGPVCGDCLPRTEGCLPVQLGTLRALEQGLRLEAARLDRLVLGPAAVHDAHRLLVRFQRFHLGVELRSERFLDEVLGIAGCPAA